MFRYFKSFFKAGSSQELLAQSLANYERNLIEAETQALLSVKMVEFYKDAIKKLNTYKVPQA
jgi:hypothetical protein